MSEQGQAIIQAVREAAARQPDYVFGGKCEYVRNGAPGCLIGHALWNLGLIGPGLEAGVFNDDDVHALLDHLSLDVDDSEATWLEIAQTQQDERSPWAEAVEAADEFRTEDMADW